ncbi:MAG: hypothetical protein QG602_2693 [Verrucomicrobiota bacterium]|nr:hypothetical protein [Verrucomicrobiota bacterium]
MNKPWKLILLLTGIFLAGGVTGSFLTVRFGRNWINQRVATEKWAPDHLRKLTERLELTSEQVEKLKPIVHRNMEEIGRLRSDSVKETRSVFERMEREIAAQLTPEQRAKFEEFNRQKRERLRKLMDRRPGEETREGARPPKDNPDGPKPPPPGPAPRDAGT